MQTGASLLKDWIWRRRYKQREAAKELGLHETFLSMLINGHRVPSLDNALLIEELTGIPVKAWSSSRRDSSQLAAASSGHKRKSDR